MVSGTELAGPHDSCGDVVMLSLTALMVPCLIIKEVPVTNLPWAPMLASAIDDWCHPDVDS